MPLQLGFKENKGISFVETMITITILGFIMMPVVTFNKHIETYKIKAKQLADLQELGRLTLESMSREIRQAVKVDTIIPDTNFHFDFTAPVSTMSIYVPNPRAPTDLDIADQITYFIGTYQGIPNRLLQRLTTYTRDVFGDVVVDTVYPDVPILVTMDYYRKNDYYRINNPTLIPEGEIRAFFKSSVYRYDDITLFWDNTRDTIAIGVTITAQQGRTSDQMPGIVTRLTLTTVATPRRGL